MRCKKSVFRAYFERITRDRLSRSVTRAQHGEHMDKYDFYDFDKVDQMRQEHEEKKMKLIVRYSSAKEKGDKLAIERALKALSRLRKKEEQMKEFAEDAGYCWY